MLWVNIKRVARSGFVGFWRNGFVSLASVVVMVITLLVISGILFSNAILTSALEQIKNRVDINAYFVTSATEEEVMAVKKTLSALPEVQRVDYISREDALTDFRAKYGNDELTLQALDELGENPFGAALNIRTRETSQYESVAKFLRGDNALSEDGSKLIYEVNYYQNKTAIDKLSYFIDSGRKLGFAATLILIAISILITFNTIRLVIYISREEIGVMKLVGASNMYIRGPFVITGIMYGVVSALIALIFLYPITYWLGTHTANFFTGLNLFDYYGGNFGSIFLIVTGSGIFLGAVSSFLAVKKYLRV